MRSKKTQSKHSLYKHQKKEWWGTNNDKTKKHIWSLQRMNYEEVQHRNPSKLSVEKKTKQKTKNIAHALLTRVPAIAYLQMSCDIPEFNLKAFLVLEKKIFNCYFFTKYVHGSHHFSIVQTRLNSPMWNLVKIGQQFQRIYIYSYDMIAATKEWSIA